jgi:lysophospholipase L1-like esterase
MMGRMPSSYGRSISIAVFAFVLFLLLGSFSFSQPVHASASLTISAATLDSTGHVLTVTMSGVSGSLSPATALTGFTVRSGTLTSGGTAWYIASSTSSGSTVTLTLGAIVPSSTTLVVDLSSGSNLTDGSGNTAAGQTGVAVTNNSSQSLSSYPYNNPNFYFIADTSTGTFDGRNYIIDSGGGDLFETILTGTDAQVLLLSGVATDLQISVDGNSTTTINTSNIASGNSFVWVPLFSGLADTPHTVVVKDLAYGDDNYFDQATTVQVKGSSPATATPTGFGTFIVANSAVNAGNILLDNYALTNVTVTGHPNTVQWTYMPGGLYFKASASDIWLYADNVSGPFSLYQDGVYLGTTLTGAQDGRFTLYHVASGLDTGVHTYEIVSSGTWITPGSSPGAAAFVYGLMLSGGSGLQSPPSSGIPIEAFYGDSITSGGGSSAIADNNGREVDTSIVSHLIGHTDYRAAAGGQTVAWGRDNTSLLAGSPHPYRLWVRLGTNDAIGGTTLGAVGTPNTFIGNYYTMLSNIRTAVGSGVPIYLEEIFPTSYYSSGTRTTYNNAIATAVNTFVTNTSDTNLKLINTDNWINTTTDTIGDGLHPNAQGYAKIANREIPLASVTGYTTSGPSSGSGTATSTNFTVTIASGATFTGDQTLTITDGGNGGTFTPSVGTASSSNVTVTPAASTTAFTFTYTPASSGTKTLTFSNGQNWTDASSTTYTATTPADVTPPTVSLTVPSSGATVSGSSVTLTATASDNVAVANVQFKVDGTNIGSVITSSPYTTTWNSTGVSDGSHTLYAVAEDTSSNYATSSITVTVHNAAAPVVVSSGGGGNGAPAGSFGPGIITGPFFVGPTTNSPSQAATPSSSQTAMPSAPGPTNAPSLSHNQQLHDVGPDVRALQQFLNQHGFVVANAGPGSPGDETTFFGLKTYRALIEFQNARSLPATGFLGPLTRALINTLSITATTSS